MRVNDKEIRDAQELLDRVGSALDLAPEVWERISKAENLATQTHAEELLKALWNWDGDHTVAACLGSGSSRVDWVEALAMYRCQDCGAKEKRVAIAQSAAIQGLKDECGATRRGTK